MRILHIKFLGLLTRFLISAARFLAHLSDERLLMVLRLANAIAKHTTFRATENNPLQEIEEIIRDDPDGNRAIRNLILEGRPEQRRSFIKGMLKHYILPRRASIIPVVTAKARSRRSGRAIRIGLIGQDRYLESIREAYESIPQCKTIAINELVEPADILSECHGLEFINIEREYISLVESALRRRKPISINYNLIRRSEELGSIFAWAPSDSPIRIWHPSLYYPPVAQVKRLIEADEIGEVTTIRVRAVLGKIEGNEFAPLSHKNYLTHSAFDHFPLLTLFGGEIEKAFSYSNPMDKVKGGQSAVSCKFTRPGLYGSLECAFAPEMIIASDDLPLDIELEIAGTDGIIWLRAGPGQKAQTPPIRVRAGKTSYTLGVESGMPVEWSAVLDNMTQEFAQLTRGKKKRLPYAEAITSAVKAGQNLSSNAVKVET